jgi:hypothetical protein
MKSILRCVIALIIMSLAYFSVASSASDTTVAFETGPFTGSVDLGEPCNDIKVEEPKHSEGQDGTIQIDCFIHACGSTVLLSKYAYVKHDMESGFSADDASADLAATGVDKDTIQISEQEINGHPGIVVAGYIPEREMWMYIANFYVSPSASGKILVWNNGSKIAMAVKTISVTEGTQLRRAA